MTVEVQKWNNHSDWSCFQFEGFHTGEADVLLECKRTPPTSGAPGCCCWAVWKGTCDPEWQDEIIKVHCAAEKCIWNPNGYKKWQRLWDWWCFLCTEPFPGCLFHACSKALKSSPSSSDVFSSRCTCVFHCDVTKAAAIIKNKNQQCMSFSGLLVWVLYNQSTNCSQRHSMVSFHALIPLFKTKDKAHRLVAAAVTTFVLFI